MNRRQNWVLPQRDEKGRVGLKALLGAAEDRRQIKPKTINTHYLDPIAQRIQHELGDARVRHIHRIAAAGQVFAAAAIARYQPIPAGIIEAPKTQGWTELIAFRGMVVHHIHHDFEAMRMQRRNHSAKFLNDGRRVIPVQAPARIRAEKPQCVVTPIIGLTPISQRGFIHAILHRQNG